MSKLPDLDDPCGQYFVYRDFVECGETWQSAGPDNTPLQRDTYSSLRRLAVTILDPVVRNHGPITLTYGLACGALIKLIKRGIAPKLDQHAAHELSVSGNRICERGGASCDFLVNGIDALTVAQWVVANTSFDRLYYYGSNRPIHVSATEDPKKQCILVKRDISSRRAIPLIVPNNAFLRMTNKHGDKK